MRGIGWAIKAMWDGNRVRRSGWNGKGMWLGIIRDYNVTPVEGGPQLAFPLLPWVGMKTATNEFVPWLCSQTDLLAVDWEIAT